MSKILIICIESPLNKSDHFYIHTLLQRKYNIGQDTKLLFLPLNGKDNYNKQDIEKKIESYKKQSSYDEAFVVYCLDKDNQLLSHSTEITNKKIQEYCNCKNYDLVWFCRTIEEVVWEKTVCDSEKIIMSKKFASNKKQTVDNKQLVRKNPLRKQSNFLLIFDKYLSRKE